ncbi:MAG: F0F1 ATP synthase subunit A [Anaerolineae bacterium]|nr:F0F1 ATP synthase subunit A [Anaerolineae bacterium]
MSKRRKVLVWAAGIIAALVVLSLLPIPKVVLPGIIIRAETVLHLFGFPITNTLLATWLTMLVLILGSWAITRRMKQVPGRLQGLLEMLIEGFYNLVEGVAGRKWARQFFPIVMTIFLFLVTSNLLGLTPLYGGWGILEPAEEGHVQGAQPVDWLNDSHTVGLWVRAEAQETEATVEGAHAEGEGLYILAPMFRSAATDLNTTIALALISVVMTQYFGVKALGPTYFGKFIAVGSIKRALTNKGVGCVGRIAALGMGFIDVFVGALETVSEFSKIISFSFRLFGNIFAGEVLLGVMAFLIPYLVSLPFFGLEIFVGIVQALVFMMLTVAFFVIGVSGHGPEGNSEEH